MSKTRPSSLTATSILFSVTATSELVLGGFLIAVNIWVTGLVAPPKEPWIRSLIIQPMSMIYFELGSLILILGALTAVASRGIWNVRTYGRVLGLPLGTIAVAFLGAFLLFVVLLGLTNIWALGLLLVSPIPWVIFILLAINIIGVVLLTTNWGRFVETPPPKAPRPSSMVIMPSYCPYCGAKLLEGSIYCSKCGTKLAY